MIAAAWDVAVAGPKSLRAVALRPMTYTEAMRAAERLNHLAGETFAYVVPYGQVAGRRGTGHWRAA